MNTAIIERCNIAPYPNSNVTYHYNVQIVTNGYYCGVGRFCETFEEVQRFCMEYNVKSIQK